MPLLDDSLEVFVTNLGKYNEGSLVGEWVKLPTTEDKMKEVFERIGIGRDDGTGHVYEEWFITDYDCSIHGVSKLLGEYENLDALNYFASRLNEMSVAEQEQFVAIMDSGCDEVTDLTSLINLTYNLDRYDFIPGIKDYDDLGRMYFEESGANEDGRFGSFVDYIDFAQYGEDCAINEDGRLTDQGYIRPTGESFKEYYDGTREDIPDEYIITGCVDELAQDNTLIVLSVEPGKEPVLKEIEPGLESLQREVGGLIEALYPFEDKVALICNEEGKLDGLPLNRGLRDEDGELYDIVAGTFLVVGLSDENFSSLDIDQIRKFSDLFKYPEQFAKLGDRIIAIPMMNKEQVRQEVFKQQDVPVGPIAEGLHIDGLPGTWHTIDHREIDGHTFYLVEHEQLRNKIAWAVVDEQCKLCLPDAFDGFSDHTVDLLHQEVMTVDKVPDETISIDEMKDYGYVWGGMLPLRQEAASEVMKSCDVFALYGDNTESKVIDADGLKTHAERGGIFGVTKLDWQKQLERENPLKAAEMSLEDDYGMIDGIINNGPKEPEKSADRTGKVSIMDRLKSAKSEPQPDKPASQKERNSDRDR